MVTIGGCWWTCVIVSPCGGLGIGNEEDYGGLSSLARQAKVAYWEYFQHIINIIIFVSFSICILGKRVLCRLFNSQLVHVFQPAAFPSVRNRSGSSGGSEGSADPPSPIWWIKWPAFRTKCNFQIETLYSFIGYKSSKIKYVARLNLVNKWSVFRTKCNFQIETL